MVFVGSLVYDWQPDLLELVDSSDKGVIHC